MHSSASSFTEHRQNERQTLLSSSQKTNSGSDKGLAYRTFAALDGGGGSMQSGSGTSTPRDNAGTNATKTIKRKIKNVNYWTYYIPILSWLPEYSLRLLPGDIAAGLTVSRPHVRQTCFLAHLLSCGNTCLDYMSTRTTIYELCFGTGSS